MTTYGIYGDGGQALTQADYATRAEAAVAAKELADTLGETVYLDTIPSARPDDDEWTGEPVEASTDVEGILRAFEACYQSAVAAGYTGTRKDWEATEGDELSIIDEAPSYAALAWGARQAMHRAWLYRGWKPQRA